MEIRLTTVTVVSFTPAAELCQAARSPPPLHRLFPFCLITEESTALWLKGHSGHYCIFYFNPLCIEPWQGVANLDYDSGSLPFWDAIYLCYIHFVCVFGWFVLFGALSVASFPFLVAQKVLPLVPKADPIHNANLSWTPKCFTTTLERFK